MFSGLVKEIKRQMPTDAEAEVLKEARAGMKAGVDADGGLIVPQDISTKINELKRALNPLDQLVTITPTTTMTGSRVMEKWAEMTPLESVDEMATIKEIDGPEIRKNRICDQKNMQAFFRFQKKCCPIQTRISSLT